MVTCGFLTNNHVFEMVKRFIQPWKSNAHRTLQLAFLKKSCDTLTHRSLLAKSSSTLNWSHLVNGFRLHYHSLGINVTPDHGVCRDVNEESLLTGHFTSAGAFWPPIQHRLSPAPDSSTFLDHNFVNNLHLNLTVDLYVCLTAWAQLLKSSRS